MYRLGPPSQEQQAAAQPLRAGLIADHLRNDPTAGQRVILDVLTFAKARHADCAQYLLGMPRPWVDRCSRTAWKIVHDASRLERHVARLTAALVNPALERKLVPPEDLSAHVARMDAEKAAREAQAAQAEAVGAPPEVPAGNGRGAPTISPEPATEPAP
jgi:hypothetical protein